MLQTKTINPVAIDIQAIPFLENLDNIKLHSEFKNAKNFNTEKGLLVVTNNKEVLPPMGIILNDADFKNFSFSNNKINVTKAEQYCSQMITYDKFPDGRILEIYLRKFIEDDFENGLGITNDEVVKIFQEKKLSSLTEEGTIIWKMIRSQGLEDLKGIIGRGRGLTPAWDDFIIGFISVLCANHADEKLRQNIKYVLKMEKDNLTTDISEDYMIKSIQGKFSQSIIRIIKSMQMNVFDEKSYLNVIKYGGTSGVDTFIGIMSAYASLLDTKTI